jgi:hypothetical protein
MEMARSLLKSMNMPGKLWGEAVRHSVYLLNRLPTKAMADKTPFEGWWGRKPNLGFLKVFGSTAHVRVAGPHLKKLADRSKPMVYLGVDEGCKAHRLLDVADNKIVVSRDIVCEEKQPWNWSDNSVEDISADFQVDVSEGGRYVMDTVNGTDDVQQAQSVSGGASNSTENEAVAVTPNHSNENSVNAPVVNAAHSSASLLPVSEQSPSVGQSSASSAEESPIRFKNLNEIYEMTEEIELDSDTEALLAIMEEPSCYKDAAGDENWQAAIENELQSITKNRTWELV